MARHRSTILLPFIMLAALLGASLLAGPRSAAAQTPAAATFGMKPEPQADPAVTASNYFIFKANPGDAVAGKVRITNPTKHAVTVELDGVDAFTAVNGGSAFTLNDAPPTAVGAWIAVKKTKLTVTPGKDQLVSFTVAVPKNATPGQHLAGLSAIETTPASATPTARAAGQAGASVDVRTRYVIAVEIDVPGAWSASLRITGATLLSQPSGRFLGLALTNDGAAFLHPTGSVTVTDASGAAVLAQSIAMGTFVTNTSIVYPIAWPDKLAPGQYRVTVHLAYGDGQTASYRGDLTVAS